MNIQQFCNDKNKIILCYNEQMSNTETSPLIYVSFSYIAWWQPWSGLVHKELLCLVHRLFCS